MSNNLDLVITDSQNAQWLATEQKDIAVLILDLDNNRLDDSPKNIIFKNDLDWTNIPKWEILEPWSESKYRRCYNLLPNSTVANTIFQILDAKLKLSINDEYLNSDINIDIPHQDIRKAWIQLQNLLAKVKS